MSRLAPLDKALVLILVSLWVVAFSLGVRTQVRGGGYCVGIALSVEDSEHYPQVTGDFSALMHLTSPLTEAGLRPGDRLIELGEADLRGVGTFGFVTRSVDQVGQELSIPLVFERDGHRFEASLPVAPVSFILPIVGASFALAVSALFLLLRGQPTPTVRAYFYFAMAWAIPNANFAGSGLEMSVWYGTFITAGFVMYPLAFRFVLRYPDDRTPEGYWHRVWPWIFSVQGVFAAFLFSRWMKIAEIGWLTVVALGAISILVVATWKYRASGPIARRQMKWVVLGAYCSVLPMGIAAAMAAIELRLGWLFFASFWVVPLIPLSLVISVLRFNLFDIDRLLSAAASYNILLVLLGAGALVAVPRLAEAASGVMGIDPGTGQVALSLALAAAVIPAHRRLRPQIDRVFFKERYALDHGIAELLPTLSTCRDARELTERAGQGLVRLLRPDGCVVYAGVEESYAPVFVEGRAVPPAFAPESPLVASLVERSAPLSLSDAGRRPDEAPLGPFDRAALETLQAEVVVPLRQGVALAAFLCLGPKRSGDVYTSTDLSLLMAVAETVSQQLQHFDQEETIREGREMQESLRRYVPGAVADQLASGADLTSAEREVTVLFVDIRGYTSFSESRHPEEIFSTVNRYTETVSQIVQEHSGSVVEFNGDGMMAVFGAPRKLAHKERAAVEAGREIVAAVAALPVEGGETLSVGVGIATGEAFVGNIQAVDRMIWSAIGNTTNLAARLQSLTRELETAVVIDSPTWERAEAAAADFEKRPDVPIRGRRATQDVYALPMNSDS